MSDPTELAASSSETLPQELFALLRPQHQKGGPLQIGPDESGCFSSANSGPSTSGAPNGFASGASYGGMDGRSGSFAVLPPT